MAGNPFFSHQRLMRIPAERFVVSLPALRAGSATDFPASAPASWRTGSPATAACSSWRSRWWKPCRAGRRPAVGGDPFRPRRHGAAYSRRYRALQRPSAWRWLPAICGVKAGAGPTPSAPRWRLTMAARSMAVSTFLPATRICTARQCRSSDRTEASPGCWISPARRIFPPAHLWLGKSGGKAN